MENQVETGLDISIEIIQKCMQNCIHCSSESCMKSKEQLEVSEILSVISDIKSIREISRISLSGGEPFLHEGLLKITSGLRKIIGKAVLQIYTSGIVENTVNYNSDVSSITKDRFIEIKESGVDKIIFNMPALDAKEFDIMTGTKMRMGLMVRSIYNALDAGLSVELNVVPNKINSNNIVGILDFCDANEIEAVNFLGLVEHGRVVKGDNAEKLRLTEQVKVKLVEWLSTEQRQRSIRK